MHEHYWHFSPFLCRFSFWWFVHCFNNTYQIIGLSICLQDIYNVYIHCYLEGYRRCKTWSPLLLGYLSYIECFNLTYITYGCIVSVIGFITNYKLRNPYGCLLCNNIIHYSFCTKIRTQQSLISCYTGLHFSHYWFYWIFIVCGTIDIVATYGIWEATW